MSDGTSGQILTIEEESAHPVVIHIHGDHAEINVNVTHYHYPEWLSKEAVIDILREIQIEKKS